MNNIKLYLTIVIVAMFGYLVVSNTLLRKEIKDIRENNAQLASNIDSLSSGSKNYVKISDLKTFESKMDSSTRSIIKAQQIKPKWVSEVIQTHVYYNNNDTTITNTVYAPTTGTYNWKVDKDCINTEGYVVISDSLGIKDVDVAITKQTMDLKVTGVKYNKKSKSFKILGLTLFRYGPKTVLVTTASDCGNAETTITQIQK